jgi:hypothetical protein
MPDRVAIGARNGTARLERATSPGGHRIIENGSASKRSTIEVACLTLDSWCERLGVHLQQIAFVKVDVQGSELDVLRGAARVLARPHIAWQMEIDVSILGQRGFDRSEMFDVLQRRFTHWVDLSRHVRGARLRTVEPSRAFDPAREPEPTCCCLRFIR